VRTAFYQGFLKKVLGNLIKKSKNAIFIKIKIRKNPKTRFSSKMNLKKTQKCDFRQKWDPKKSKNAIFIKNGIRKNSKTRFSSKMNLKKIQKCDFHQN
jgi:hypothetical protein